MLRPVLFAIAVVALVAPAPAAAPDLSGNWLFTAVGPGGETAICILKVESKDGKPSASVVFSPANVETSVASVRATDSSIDITLKQTRTLRTAQGDRKTTSEIAFVGLPGKDPKVILGSTGTATLRSRAKLTATDKTTLTPQELTVRTPMPEPMTKAQQLSSKALAAQSKYVVEKDADKKKELLKEAQEAAREANEQLPVLYREVVEKHADSPAAFDASMNLMRGAARNKPTPELAAKMVKVLQDGATPYGTQFLATTMAPVAETLVAQSGLEAVALSAIEPAAKAMTDDYPVAMQMAVLSPYLRALEKTGKTAEAKAISTRVAGLETKMDAEYLKTVPPFKPTVFAGRKDANANRVAVMELFTGAQCPPCVAADVGFDALLKAYKPTDVILLQYHVHIPGPDPLTNADTVARQRYYAVNSAPSSFFNGERAAAGGGAMAAAEGKFQQYVSVVNPLLEKSTPIKIAGNATRKGDKIDIAVEVANGDGEDMKLRLVLVEESVKYVGGNQIRFHHQVVRAMPGGVDGVAVKDKAFKHTAAVDLGNLRKELTKYLDDYAANVRPFPKPERPMDMKALKVVALVQNDKTKEIVQAVQFGVEGGAAGGGGQ